VDARHNKAGHDEVPKTRCFALPAMTYRYFGCGTIRI
jgi:hypothetical protein